MSQCYFFHQKNCIKIFIDFIFIFLIITIILIINFNFTTTVKIIITLIIIILFFMIKIMIKVIVEVIVVAIDFIDFIIAILFNIFECYFFIKSYYFIKHLVCYYYYQIKMNYQQMN